MARETFTAIAYAINDFLSSSSTSLSRSLVISRVFLNSSVNSGLVSFLDLAIIISLNIQLLNEFGVVLYKLSAQLGLVAHQKREKSVRFNRVFHVYSYKSAPCGVHSRRP